ncbi:MAG: Zn-ribbon domain-containing OB-fold protein [Bacillota bacterium]
MSTQRFWREIPRRYRLEASRCRKCRKDYLPSRKVCPECESTEFDVVRMPDRGTVVAHTVIHVAPPQWRMLVPYVVAIVELENGTRITTQVVDCEPEDVKIGQKVKLEFRRLTEDGASGTIVYGHKAVPID